MHTHKDMDTATHTCAIATRANGDVAFRCNMIDPDLNFINNISNTCDYIWPENISRVQDGVSFSNMLSMLSFNIRSVLKNYDALIELVNPIIDCIDCIGLTETCMTVNAKL